MPASAGPMTKNLVLRLHPEVAAQLAFAARLTGLTTSEYVRRILAPVVRAQLVGAAGSDRGEVGKT